METPKISVIIPHYNHRAQLPRAIESILAQTYQDFEIIIVNQSFMQPVDNYCLNDKVRVVTVAGHLGTSIAMNLGIDRAEGDFIAIQDADDASMNYRFGVCEKYMKDYDLIYGDMINVDRKGHFTYIEAHDFTEKVLSKISLAVSSSIMVKTEIAKQVPFREGIGYGDDRIWTLDLLKSGLVKKWTHIGIPFYYFHNYTSTYRVRPGKLPYLDAIRGRFRLRKLRKECQRKVDEIL